MSDMPVSLVHSDKSYIKLSALSNPTGHFSALETTLYVLVECDFASSGMLVTLREVVGRHNGHYYAYEIRRGLE